MTSRYQSRRSYKSSGEQEGRRSNRRDYTRTKGHPMVKYFRGFCSTARILRRCLSSRAVRQFSRVFMSRSSWDTPPHYTPRIVNWMRLKCHECHPDDIPWHFPRKYKNCRGKWARSSLQIGVKCARCHDFANCNYLYFIWIVNWNLPTYIKYISQIIRLTFHCKFSEVQFVKSAPFPISSPFENYNVFLHFALVFKKKF